MSHTLYFYATCQEKKSYLKISRYVCNCLISITFTMKKKNKLQFNISTHILLNFVLHQNESNIRYITFRYFVNIVYSKCSKYKSRRTMTGILNGDILNSNHTRTHKNCVTCSQEKSEFYNEVMVIGFYI